MASTGKRALQQRLIEAVREHEVLYNCDLKEYSHNILKMRLWRQIARKCDIASGELFPLLLRVTLRATALARFSILTLQYIHR